MKVEETIWVPTAWQVACDDGLAEPTDLGRLLEDNKATESLATSKGASAVVSDISD